MSTGQGLLWEVGEDMAKTWVTKTDIARYFRCPYAFWLVDSARLEAEALFSPLTTQLVAKGVAFQASVEAPMPKVEVPAGGLAELFRRPDLGLYGIPKVKNQSLRVMGTPDGVETARGALYPIEVKSHRKPVPLDRVELAFYWVLLAPHRSAWPDPEGILVLPGDEAGTTTTVRVALTTADFDQVHALVAAVRTARAEGVEPQMCRCQVCSARPEVQARAGARRDLTMIFGINSAYSAALRALGCRDHGDLLAVDPVATVAGFKERKLCISVGMVERWKLHARAYAEGRPVLLEHQTPLPELGRYIALDLEWDLGGRIWLAGAGLVVGHEVTEYHQWWSADGGQLNTMVGLTELLKANPNIPVVTWNGKGADLPRLREHCTWLYTEALMEDIEGRHLDLYLWAQDCLRLPVPTLGLKELASALGFAKASTVASGMEALGLLFQYQATKSRKERRTLREQLEAYNRDDVASLAHVAAHIVALDAPTLSLAG
jgi:predicted RecB family nuclease